MHSLSRKTFWLIIGSMMLGACAPDSTTPQRPQVGRPTGDVVPSAPMTPLGPADDNYLRLVGLAPEFGGLFVDTTGTLTIALTDTTKAPAFQSAAAAVLGDKFISQHASRPWRVLLARYSYGTLAAWRNVLLPLVLNAPGGVGIGIDHRLNRILVGVIDETSIASTGAIASKLGIPADALLIDKQAQPRHLSVSLQDASCLPG